MIHERGLELFTQFIDGPAAGETRELKGMRLVIPSEGRQNTYQPVLFTVNRRLHKFAVCNCPEGQNLHEYVLEELMLGHKLYHQGKQKI